MRAPPLYHHHFQRLRPVEDFNIGPPGRNIGNLLIYVSMFVFVCNLFVDVGRFLLDVGGFLRIVVDVL